MLQNCLPARGVNIPNLKGITQAISEIQAAKISIFLLHFFPPFSSIGTFCKNSYKTQMRNLIALKFGKHKGCPKENPSITFGETPMNSLGCMINYSRETISICCHAYRVNCFISSKSVSGYINQCRNVLWWFESNQNKNLGDMTQKQRCVIIACTIKICV